jgi:hypothetical protein
LYWRVELRGVAAAAAVCCGMFFLHCCAFVLGLAPSCIVQKSVQSDCTFFQAAIAHGDAENGPLSC